MLTPGTKPRTTWALASLACGVGGWAWFVGLGWALLSSPRGDTTGVTISILFLGLVITSGFLWLVGIVFGIVALARISSGRYGGQWAALAGIVLGSLPFLLVLTWVGYHKIRWGTWG